MWWVIIGGLLVLTGTPVRSSCVVDISPKKIAVKILDPLSANCTTMSNETDSMGWESSNGGTTTVDDVSFLPLNITSVEDWGLKPKCFLNLNDGSQCEETLPVVVYKLPDSVTLKGGSSTWVEGQSYQLECDLVNVAPARIVSVSLHIGNKIVHGEAFSDSSKRPVNVSSVYNVTATRDDNGRHIWCEAKLDLMEMSVNVPPVMSAQHDVIVHYPPTLVSPDNETLLFETEKLVLNCTATGNPEPKYNWQLPNSTERTGSILTLSTPLPGTYTCTVFSSQGKSIKYFTVEVKENHLILIIGIVVVIVLALAIIFIIYSVYYNKTRIRQYKLQHFKPSTNNGRVAHDTDDVL